MRSATTTRPKIELHVHLEGTVSPGALLALAKRNGAPLPRDVGELEAIYAQCDLERFPSLWRLIVGALREPSDFEQIVVDYARTAKSHGAVYVEGIFSPIEPVRRGLVGWEEIFSGYCDGVQCAREEVGVEVRLTPDVSRGVEPEDAELAVRHAIAFKDRGVVGIGLGGRDDLSPEPYARSFASARAAGLGVVPHSGDFSDGDGLRRDLDLLRPTRLRHGIRAVDRPDLLAELAEKEIVLDVCLTSNLRLGTVPSLEQHPLPRLIAAGVRCSISTDNPALFATDLEREWQLAAALGADGRTLYETGVRGALCDPSTRQRLSDLGSSSAA
jgi:aminodeoxyfutalosine deaminase